MPAVAAAKKVLAKKPTPESVLKKRKANELIAADRAQKQIERKKVFKPPSKILNY